MCKERKEREKKTTPYQKFFSQKERSFPVLACGLALFLAFGGAGIALLIGLHPGVASAQEPFLVKDINQTGSSAPQLLTDVNGTLFFSADDGIQGGGVGGELWKSDGTEAGTVLVKDINPGRRDSDPLFLTNVNGMLFFGAIDGIHGHELWQSDGTQAGTVLVKDIRPGPENSQLGSLTNVNGTLFFTARDGVHGQELWTLNPVTSVQGNIINDKISPMSLLVTFTPGDNIFQFMLNMTNTSSDTIFSPTVFKRFKDKLSALTTNKKYFKPNDCILELDRKVRQAAKFYR